MDVRHQIFVSSTYTDLVDERRAVIQCLLAMDCIPAGMELFPAADESVWSLIESVIKESDYYVLIIGGRYGAASRDNPLSYTEREYDLATCLGVPILAFLHADPGKIVQDKTDRKDDARNALDRFRKKVSDAHHVKFWTDPHDLAAKAMLGIRYCMKTRPRVGWIRADQAMDAQTGRELERLRRENTRLKAKAESDLGNSERESETIIFRDELISGDVLVSFKRDPPTGTRNDSRPTTTQTIPIDLLWSRVFAAVGPAALEGMSEYEVSSRLREIVEFRIRRQHANEELYDLRVSIPDEIDGKIKTQFMALKWWTLERPLGARGYPKWWLTDLGRSQLIKLLVSGAKGDATTDHSGRGQEKGKVRRNRH